MRWDEDMISLYFSENEIINLVEQYYREEEGREVKVSIYSKKECVGIYEEEGCVTNISVKEEFDILGMKKNFVTTIGQEELKDILNLLLEKEGYEVVNLMYNDGLRSECAGYGMHEYQIKKAYFNGVTLTLNNVKAKPKTRSRVL